MKAFGRFAHVRERVVPAIRSGPDLTVSVIIPAHNEEHRIAATLEDYAQTFGDEAEFVIVLNGCTDGTRDVVRCFEERDSRFHVVELRAAVGKGGAVRSGFAIAHAPIVGYVDADGATPAEEFRRLVYALGDNDAVIASRWLPGADVKLRQPLVRRIASRVFNGVVRLLFGLPYLDTQCGAKIFRRSALRKIDVAIETADFSFDVDLLFALRRTRARILEVPTRWNDCSNSKVRLARASARMLMSILRLRLRHSIFRVVIPLFDRLMGTHSMRTHRGLRILIVNWRDVKHPRAGGAETYCHEIAKRLVARGHCVEWLTAGFSGAPREEVVDGIRIHRTGNRATVYLTAPFYYLRRLRDRFDIIIDGENGIPFFTPLFSLKPKMLLVHHVHRKVFLERMPFPINRLFVWLELGLVPKIYRHVPVIAVSEDTRRELERYGKTALPISVVNPGVDASCVPGEKASQPEICYVGRLEPYKRIDLLLEAMVDVVRRVPAATLRIVGTGTDATRLRDMAHRLGLGEAVRFSGFADEAEKLRTLQRAWVFVSPSSMEGWGISAIEAHACGTPAVAFDVPGLREAIVDGRSGTIVNDHTPEALASALVRYLDDANLRSAHAAGARERAKSMSWERAADALYACMLREALDQPFHLFQEDQTWHIVARETSAPLTIRSQSAG